MGSSNRRPGQPRRRGEMEMAAIRISDVMERVESGGCVLAAFHGTGDCVNVVGLPGVSKPGEHDGPDDTVDAFGKPNGWCWACWYQHQIREAQKERVQLAKDVGVKMRRLVAALGPLAKFAETDIEELCAGNTCISRRDVREAAIAMHDATDFLYHHKIP